MQQAVDEETQAAIGGNAARGGVRRANESLRFEISEDVAHRRGADVDTRLRRELARWHGRTFRNVVLDQQLEHELGAAIEELFRLLSHRSYNLTVALREDQAKPAAVLKALTVRDFALVQFLDIAFDDGLTVITGESGAGKSILLGALGLVLGDRAAATRFAPAPNART